MGLKNKPQRESKYRENKVGPRIEPWGTPLVTGTELEENTPISTEKLLFVSYNA